MPVQVPLISLVQHVHVRPDAHRTSQSEWSHVMFKCMSECYVRLRYRRIREQCEWRCRTISTRFWCQPHQKSRPFSQRRKMKGDMSQRMRSSRRERKGGMQWYVPSCHFAPHLSCFDHLVIVYRALFHMKSRGLGTWAQYQQQRQPMLR